MSSDLFIKKQAKIISDMRDIHGDQPNHILLNWSFRSGDPEHCQWTSYEEEKLLPLLVSEGTKPVCEFAHKRRRDLNHIKIPFNCGHIFVKNRWNMWCLMIYNPTMTNEAEMKLLADEYLPYRRIGYLYGYYSRMDEYVCDCNDGYICPYCQDNKDRS